MITDIATRLEFPDEAILYFEDCLNTARKYENVMDLFRISQEDFFTGEEHVYQSYLQKISDITGINRYSVDMLFLLISAERLHNDFSKNGYGDGLFYELMYDLCYKLYECKNLYGIWGTFVLQWFRNGYRLNRFKLGRLQYQIGECPVENYKGIVKKGEPIYYIHIPSSGPLEFDDVIKSLRDAYKFYSDKLIDGKLVLFCESWLLYEPIFKDYNENSNIKRFYNLFDIVKNIDDVNNSDFWRVFNIEYSKEAIDKINADNSLKTVVLNHIKNGGTMGEGLGVLIIDEKF